MRRAQRWAALVLRPAQAAALPVHSSITIPSIASRHASSIPYPTSSRKIKENGGPSSNDGHKTTRIRRSRGENNKRLTSEKRSGVPQVHIDAQLINTQSLAATLQAHRQANEDSVLVRNYLSSGSEVHVAKPKVETAAQRLILKRATDRGSRDEYEGKPPPLSLDWELIGNVPRYLRSPWVQSLDAGGRTRDYAQARLSQEIRAADAYFTPTAQETEAAHKAHSDIATLILSSAQPVARVDPIGSRVSGLSTPLSDIDLNVMVKGDTARPIERVSMQVLSAIFTEMKHSKLCPPEISTSFFAAGARIPIIVGMHGPTGLEFQIQAASSGYGSLELIRCLAAEHPTLRALFRILKQMLKMRGLAEGSRGGLTSYPLLNMIVASLKLNSTETDPYDIGSHLLQFLHFYGNLNFYESGITHVPSKHLDGDRHYSTDLGHYRDESEALLTISSVTRDPAGAIPVLFNARKALPLVYEGKNDYMMTLHDPANPYNDLGRSAYLIKHIQATFLDISRKLKEVMSEWDRQIRAEGQAAERPLALLNPLLEGDYSMYKMERKRLETWLNDASKLKSGSKNAKES